MRGVSRRSRAAILVILAALAFLGLFLLTPARTLAADPLIPGRPAGTATYGSTPPLYEDERYSPYSYTFEGLTQFRGGSPQPIYFWMNELLVAKAWLLKLALRTVEYALVQDFLTPQLNRAAQAAGALGGLLWQGSAPLVVGALSLTGLWAVWLYLRGRASRLWGALGGSLLILLLTAALLSAGKDGAAVAGAASRDLARQAYGTIDALGRNQQGWGLTAGAGDALWRTLVYQPWVDGEFGSDAGAQLYGQINAASFLTKSAVDRHLICDDQIRMTAYCPWWSDEYLPQRMLMAGWTFLAGAVVSGALIALGGGMILAQVALLLLLALAPVWLLIALWWPAQGVRLLSAVWLRALGALLVQVVLAVTLGVLLLLALGVAAAFTGSWMLASLVLTGLAGLAFRYRTAWLEPLARAPRGLAGWIGGGARDDTSLRGRTSAAGTSATGLGSVVPAFASLGAMTWQPDGPPAPVPASPDAAWAAGGPGGSVAGRRPSESLAREAAAPASASLVFFRSELQVLREQLTMAERTTIREELTRPGLSPGEREWGSHASPGLAAAGRRVPRSEAGEAEVTRIPSQRPRGS
jgi:hypothetical protein